MASISKALLMTSSTSTLLILMLAASANAHFFLNTWKDAHATYYGGPDGSGTFGGACGYEEKEVKNIYGVKTAALSDALFQDGKTCGACYEIKCAQDEEKLCKPNQGSIVVTATNQCPPSDSRCSGSKHHFDLPQPTFIQLAEQKAGVVPIKYRRVPCKKQGGIRFTITGNPYFNLVSIANVGGAGDVAKLEVKDKIKGTWTALERNWGQKWETNAKLVGQDLTFRVTTSDGRTFISEKAVPKHWTFGQTFEGGNFV